MENKNMTINSSAYPEFIDDHNCALAHASNYTPLSVEQVLILDHIAMLLQLLKHDTNPQGHETGVAGVDSCNFVARINDLLKIYGKYGE